MAGNGRFSNLEFDGPAGDGPGSEGQSQGGKGQPGQPVQFIKEVKDASFYFKRALLCELAGAHEQALRNYSAALNENPLLLAGWVGQLRMLLHLGEYPEVKMWSDKAMEKFPDNPQLLSAKAIAIHRLGYSKEARDLCDLAIQKSGETPLEWLCRGEILLAGQTASAEQCFNHALRVSPDIGRTRIEIGELYLNHKQYSLALAALQQACTEEPRSAWAWYLLGKTQQELGMLEQAKRSYGQASSLYPKNKKYRRAAAMELTFMTKLKSYLRRRFKND
ncbi:MAG: tetratricopeptide repeat protein [Planctomycetes bacterium]|nr:tetratricopeptide repeat protein [Planctomycetota bacterium]